MALDYASNDTPPDYTCKGCDAHGVRLWRAYQTMGSDLLCAECAETRQRKSREPAWRSEYAQGRGDQIGWWVPAVPCEEGGAWWGYTTVPPEGVAWWPRLPDRRPLP
jgi:hypothetical protein